ncbi:hypothetical protein NLM24_07810 [Nocardia zapadnayensis]|uniref:hypothetical protein n=1 Tax=Nocardia rhamnosiphila TaxID=426716 RepID=UPI0022474009|nr:hypothetical protein [Nocardia zapadnayensis]MCX0270610.1 hypothetical protein [Nocardia zapadnayensis]
MNDHEQKFDEEALTLVVRMHREGRTPSQILREIIRLYPDVSTPDLMELMQNAFSLPHESVQCIGGWWMDETGELSDTELDAFLSEEIAKVSPR